MPVPRDSIHEKRFKFNGYRQDEPIDGHYFRLPKDLFSNPFNGLSSDARLLYAILLDRLELSRKNGWVNNDGEIYQLFSRKELGKLLNLSRPTITKAFRQLVEAGLIREVRQGLNKPNIIYVGKIPDELRKERMLRTEGKEIFPPEGKDLSPIDPDIIKPKINKPDTYYKREFSGEPKNSSPSQDNKNYSEWIRIINLKFPNSLSEYTLKRFICDYKKNMGQEHPPIKNVQLESCFIELESFFTEKNIIEESNVDVIIAKYFKTDFSNANNGNGCDYRFNHFCTKGVLQRRYWEELFDL